MARERKNQPCLKKIARVELPSLARLGNVAMTELTSNACRKSLIFTDIGPMSTHMSRNPDIAFEVWAPDAARKGWQIIVDRHVLGTLKSQLDAIEYAKTAAKEAAEEASLHTVVVSCRPGGQRRRIAVFGDPEA